MHGQVRLGYAVKFGLELGGTGRRRSQRIELYAQMAVLADGLYQGRGACDFP